MVNQLSIGWYVDFHIILHTSFAKFNNSVLNASERVVSYLTTTCFILLSLSSVKPVSHRRVKLGLFAKT